MSNRIWGEGEKSWGICDGTENQRWLAIAKPHSRRIIPRFRRFRRSHEHARTPRPPTSSTLSYSPPPLPSTACPAWKSQRSWITQSQSRRGPQKCIPIPHPHTPVKIAMTRLMLTLSVWQEGHGLHQPRLASPISACCLSWNIGPIRGRFARVLESFFCPRCNHDLKTKKIYKKNYRSCDLPIWLSLRSIGPINFR